jgi:hypothetical protein
MSSATSTSARVASAPAVKAEADRNTFRASHFFVLASLMAATGAVLVARQSTPEHLILISLTIGSAGLAAAGFFRVLSPLVGADSSTGEQPISERERAVLDREKTLVLRALKDLEFDRSMGKVSQKDFDDMAARLRGRALSLMKQLDEDGTGYRSLIERELTARVAARAARPDAAPAAAVADPPPALAGVCACGTANDPDARFCKQCGSKLSDAPVSGASLA